MQKDLVYGEHSDIISIPLERVMEDSAQRVEYSFRKSKTSDFFDENIRTFEAKHPYFCPKKSDVLLLPDRCLSLSFSKEVFEFLAEINKLSHLLSLS